MTILCAIHEPGVGTWIGSDRQWTSGNRRIIAEPKWAVHGLWAIGVSGDGAVNCAVGQKIADLIGFEPEVAGITTRLLKMLPEIGIKPIENDGSARNYDQGFLIACPGAVWRADGTGCIVPQAATAGGSGSEYALGALYANRGGPARGRLEMAIAAACYWDTGCGGEPCIHLLKAE